MMNDRIKELEKQATTVVEGWSDENGTTRYYEFNREKFAELIIRDCMHDCLRMQLGKQYTPEELLFQTKYRKIIKKHFGVEE
jgi:hypothetical protein